MLDPAMFNQMAPQFPEHEQLKCPRCESTNTKFCYYNNYNLSQPRHYCKNCRRYWTKGGSLRNIPVGGGTRKNSKRSSNPKRQANSGSEPEPARIQKQLPIPAPQVIQNSPPVPDPNRIYGLPGDQERKVLEIPGNFSSLLSSDGHFGNLLTGLNPNGSDVKTVQISNFGRNLEERLDLKTGTTGSVQDSGLEENYLGGDLNCWGGGSSGSWPDLSIYTPGSTFQ